MTLPYAIMLFVTLQRISELFIARSNTSALLARGAVEYGASHYPVMVLLHASWLAVLWATVGGAPVNMALLGVFAMLQAMRICVLATLGRRGLSRTARRRATLDRVRLRPVRRRLADEHEANCRHRF